MDENDHPCAMPVDDSYAAAAGLWTCTCERHWRRTHSGAWREIPTRTAHPRYDHAQPSF